MRLNALATLALSGLFGTRQRDPMLFAVVGHHLLERFLHGFLGATLAALAHEQFLQRENIRWLEMPADLHLALAIGAHPLPFRPAATIAAIA